MGYLHYFCSAIIPCVFTVGELNNVKHNELLKTDCIIDGYGGGTWFPG